MLLYTGGLEFWERPRPFHFRTIFWEGRPSGEALTISGDNAVLCWLHDVVFGAGFDFDSELHSGFCFWPEKSGTKSRKGITPGIFIMVP
jgi:hypothetical protein